ncbi:AI-2E family transporter [Vulgatibacter incomptus]|uniref:AI-2E family transporter n=1 Tax=Vulgatibacter incomptus TaxID=1391653 RepID=UPI0014701974|nr:AI-2E family transporter [Vulgatibacter incomptus]
MKPIRTVGSPSSAPSRAVLVRVAALWLAIAVALVAFRGVLFTFGGALLIAYLAEPIVTRLSSKPIGGRTLPRWAGILAVYAALFLLVYAFSIAALPQLYRELVRLVAEARELLNELTPAKISAYTRAAEEWLASRGIPIVFGDGEPLPAPSDSGPKLHFDLEATLRSIALTSSTWARTHLMEVVGVSQRIVTHLVGGIFQLFFMLMVAAFVLLDPAPIRSFFRSLVPVQWGAGFDSLLARIDDKLAGVVRGQILICLVNGALTLVGLLILKVKFALILATLATLLSFIPIFGTVISTVPIVLVALTQSFGTALGALGWVLGIHGLEAYLLNPRILGTSARIHPVVIAFALLAGERTFGFAGALFAVPVASILLAVFLHFKERADRLQAEELGADVQSDAKESAEAGS